MTRPRSVAEAVAKPMPLRARRMGIHTQHEAVVFMRTDCPVCRSEGLSAHSRVLIQSRDREVLATLYQVSSDILEIDEVGLSESAWARVAPADGEPLFVHHPELVKSFRRVRARIFGNRLAQEDFGAVLSDIAAGRYSDIELSAFITGTSAFPLDEAETEALTRSMVEIGDRLTWPVSPIVDKHSVGGLPGNRTTPIVVAIVAAHGLTMPKTSSRAITSPAGTADTMETMAPVDLSVEEILRVVETGVWLHRLGRGGPPQSRRRRAYPRGARAGHRFRGPAGRFGDVEENRGRLHPPVLDMPVGPTAKVRSKTAAIALGDRLAAVGPRAFRSRDRQQASRLRSGEDQDW